MNVDITQKETEELDDIELLGDDNDNEFTQQQMLKIIDECQGKDENDEPRIATAVQVIMSSDDSDEDIMNFTTGEPFAEITIYNDITFIHIEFITHLSSNLRLLYNALEKFDELESNGTQEPVFILQFSPKKYYGKYLMNIINPMFWSFTGDFNEDTINSVDIFVPTENINFLQTELTKKQIESEIYSELKRKEFLNSRKDI